MTLVFAQVRAVSNVVERRNRDAWKMADAIGSLGTHRAEHPRSRMTLSLGFSPCPNDCFMFDAIVNRRIDLEGLEFSVRMADVEALNKAAFAGDADVTKLSYHAYAHCASSYVLLDAGSALGQELRTAAHFQAGDREGGSGRGTAQDRDSRKIHHRQFPARPGVSRARETGPSSSSPPSSRRC